MLLAKGKPKTGGRKKGVPNKITASVREAITHAFNTVGGETYLVRVARKHPAVFCAVLAKLIPLQVTGAHGGPIETTDVSARERIMGKLAEMAARTREEEDAAARNGKEDAGAPTIQ
jgi:hypothetical protein